MGIDVIIYAIIAVIVIAAAVAAALMMAQQRKPPTQQTQSFRAPQSTLGEPIRVIFGTRLVRDIQLCWWGDLKIKKVPLPQSTQQRGKK